MPGRKSLRIISLSITSLTIDSILTYQNRGTTSLHPSLSLAYQRTQYNMYIPNPFHPRTRW